MNVVCVSLLLSGSPFSLPLPPFPSHSLHFFLLTFFLFHFPSGTDTGKKSARVGGGEKGGERATAGRGEAVKIAVNRRDIFGRTALHYACSSLAHPVSLVFLLSLFFFLFLFRFPHSPFPLSHEKVSRLVENGANKSARDSNERTPLLYAAMAKNFHVFTYLLELSSPEEMVMSDKEGYTALHIASSLGFFFVLFCFVLFFSFFYSLDEKL